MTATAIASVVGEAISATRWYWAVLTAFLVFVSTTTRSGILTRAYRRVLGTVLGLAAGIVVVYFAHNVTGVLLAICLLCIMGMIYFAPLNYLYASFFVTTMLVALYAMMGVLQGRLLELRLEETVAGCVCGVLCAYLLLSTTSGPALVTDVDHYFDAVDDLLTATSQQSTPPAAASELLAGVHKVESAQAVVDKTLSAMAAALVVVGRDRVDTARSLMGLSSRSAVGYAQAVISSEGDPTATKAMEQHRDALQGAVDKARVAATEARQQIDRPGESVGASPAAAAAESSTMPTQDTVGASTDAPTVRSALVSLARFTWVMNRLSGILAPTEDPVYSRLRLHAL